MKALMHVGPNGLALIKHFEGFRETAYLDGGGVPTIGYGHTRGVTLGQHIGLAEGERLLREDIRQAESLVNVAVVVPLTQNQFDAMTSIMFNVGPGSPQRDGIIHLRNNRPSTLMRHLNAGDYAGAAAHFEEWDHDAGVVVAGLRRRRLTERELFLTPDNAAFDLMGLSV